MPVIWGSEASAGITKADIYHEAASAAQLHRLEGTADMLCTSATTRLCAFFYHKAASSSVGLVRSVHLLPNLLVL